LSTGERVTRPFTPVDAHFPVSPLRQTPQDGDAGDELHLLIKLYANGAMSTALRNLHVNSALLVSDSAGNVDVPARVRLPRHLCMFAGGSGITPIIGMLQEWAIVHDNK
jgi:ferredoxin-NADP reductase